MGISFNFGTGAQGATVNKALAPWLYSDAIRIISDNGSLAKLADIKSPLDKQTTIKISLDKIANVYTTLANGTIPVAAQSANTSGSSLFVEVKTVATKTDGTTTIQLPMVARIEIRVPNDADIADTDIDTLILAAYASLCDSSGACKVVTEKLRGALTPVGI